MGVKIDVFGNVFIDAVEEPFGDGFYMISNSFLIKFGCQKWIHKGKAEI